MSKKYAKTYSEAMLEIVDRWKMAGGQWPAPTQAIAAFAIQKKLWEAPRRSILKQCQNDLSRAMREASYVDPQGRIVRSLHAARYLQTTDDGRKEQRVLWADMRDPETTRDHMERAFQLRRKQIVGDCWQLKTDADSFNDNHPQFTPIQLVFDFTPDVEEMGQPGEYRPGDNGDLDD